MKLKYIFFVSPVLLVGGAICLYLIFWGSYSELDSMIPNDRCVKSAYNDEGRKDRISINCQDYDRQVYTIILRKFEKKEDIKNVLANFKNGKNVKSFLCSNFSNSKSEVSENNISTLHSCYSEKNSIMITSTSQKAVLFFISQFRD